MSQGADAVLRNSLDAVDRFRTRLTVGIALLFVTVAFTLGSLMAAAASTVGNAGQTKILLVSVVAQMVFIAFCAAIVVSQISRMTKMILRAIELSGEDGRAPRT